MKPENLEFSPLSIEEMTKQAEEEQKTLKYKISYFFYRVYDLLISPHNWYNRFKWFFQRRIRGFDDREIWSLDTTFYNWLLPRMERFLIVNSHSYPDRYKTHNNWHNEIKERIKQLKLIKEYQYQEYNFPYPTTYIPQDRIQAITSDIDEERIKFNLNIEGYAACRANFMVWFSNNIPDLWD